MRELFIVAASLVAFFCFFIGGSNREYVKDNAEQAWQENGYVVEGYVGYQWSPRLSPFSQFGGATVYYHLSRPDNNTLYLAGMRRWGDELHIYSVHAVDAFRPAQ